MPLPALRLNQHDPCCLHEQNAQVAITSLRYLAEDGAVARKFDHDRMLNGYRADIADRSKKTRFQTAGWQRALVRGEAVVDRAAEFAASVENDPKWA